MSHKPQLEQPAFPKIVVAHTRSNWAWADAIFLFRPVLLGPVWTIYMAGYLLAGGLFPGLDLAAFTLLVGGIYIHNQLEDMDSDKLNNKLFLLSEGLMERRFAWAIMAVSWILAIIWASQDTERAVVYTASMCLGLAYNHPLLSWKDRPMLGLASNMAGHGSLTFLAGWIAAGGELFAGMLWSAPYAMAVGSTYLLTAEVDARGDAIAGKHTIPVMWGAARSRGLALTCCAAALAGAVFMGDLWMVLVSAGTLGFFAWAAYTHVEKSAGLIARLAVGLLALTIAFRWPAFLLLASGVFMAARLYYSRRFDMTYPSVTNGE